VKDVKEILNLQKIGGVERRWHVPVFEVLHHVDW
jgi:hypothetical protein